MNESKDDMDYADYEDDYHDAFALLNEYAGTRICGVVMRNAKGTAFAVTRQPDGSFLATRIDDATAADFSRKLN